MPTVAHTPLVAVRKLPADDDMDNGISNHPLCVILHSAENQEIAADDPYRRLEDVNGDKAFAWVCKEDARTEAALTADPTH